MVDLIEVIFFRIDHFPSSLRRGTNPSMMKKNASAFKAIYPILDFCFIPEAKDHDAWTGRGENPMVRCPENRLRAVGLPISNQEVLVFIDNARPHVVVVTKQK